ncbi:hypothetical protein Tco_0070737 [Tanacetum coccineum]
MELEDHVPVYIPEPEHPKDLVSAEDEAPIEAYIIEVASAPPPPPSFLPPLIRPPRTRAAMAQMRAAAPSTTPIRDTTITWGCEVGWRSSAAVMRDSQDPYGRRVDCVLSVYKVDVRSRESSEFYSRHHDAQKDRAAVRAEIEVLRRERLTYEQESMEKHSLLGSLRAYGLAIEARITSLETQAHRHEWQRQDADDRATRHIMRIQALEAGAHDDTLEDTGSSA